MDKQQREEKLREEQRQEIRENPWVIDALKITKIRENTAKKLPKKTLKKSPEKPLKIIQRTSPEKSFKITQKKSPQKPLKIIQRKSPQKPLKIIQRKSPITNKRKRKDKPQNNTKNIIIDREEFKHLLRLMREGSKDAEKRLDEISNEEDTLKDVSYFGGK